MHPTPTLFLPGSIATSTPYDARLTDLSLMVLYSSTVARVTASTTTFPTASENGGHIMEK